VQIYSHDSVDWSNSLGKKPIKKKKTKIGNAVYLGPNSIIQMGITIDDKAIIGALSFVNKDVPKNKKWYQNKLKT
jgi:acetyltransferase-like isoleucine patch superfamily enzyme